MGPVRYGVIFESFACKTIRTCTFAYSLYGSVDFKRYLFTMILSGEFRSHSKKLPFLRTLKISLTHFFKLILCWWRPSCLATGPEVKECRIKIFSKVQELLMLQYQEQFQYISYCEFHALMPNHVKIKFIEILERSKNRECNKLATPRKLFGTLLDGKHIS